jgi:hypothetical protein
MVTKHSLGITNNQLENKMKKSIIYPSKHCEYNKRGEHLSHYYLHNELDIDNHFDLCSANTQTLLNCLKQGIFIVDIYGRKKKGLLLSFYDFGQMRGYITYIDDLEGLEFALEESKGQCHMYWSHDQEILATDYPETNKFIFDTNRKIRREYELDKEAQQWFNKMDTKLYNRYVIIYNNRYRNNGSLAVFKMECYKLHKAKVLTKMKALRKLKHNQ